MMKPRTSRLPAGQQRFSATGGLAVARSPLESAPKPMFILNIGFAVFVIFLLNHYLIFFFTYMCCRQYRLSKV